MRKEPSQLGAHGAGGFEDGDMKSILKSILDLIWNGVIVDLGSIWAPFGINLRSILESIWGSFGVHFGVNLGSMSRFGRGSSFRPRRDQIFGPLDRFWGLF